MVDISKRQREIDDEILQLSYMEDKLRRALNREDQDSPHHEVAARQLAAVMRKLDDLEDERVLAPIRATRAERFETPEPSQPVRFLGIQEAA